MVKDRQRKFSYKVNEHYTELSSGKKFHAPKGLSCTNTSWCVNRFGVLKYFPIEKYGHAYNFLMELNRSNLKDPSLHHVTRRKEEMMSKKHSFGETCVTANFVALPDCANVYAQIHYYDPVRKHKTYLRGSNLSLSKIEDYRPELHADSINEAKRIRKNLLLLENAILASIAEEEASHV